MRRHRDYKDPFTTASSPPPVPAELRVLLGQNYTSLGLSRFFPDTKGKRKSPEAVALAN